MKRIKLIVAYDGTNYCGWQIQPNGITIQEVLNKALSQLLGEPINVMGASRTDSGVHALGNVAVFNTENRMPAGKVCFALNQRLPEDIRILQSGEVPLDWHPRKQNSIKTYEYRIQNSRIPLPSLRLYSYACHYPLDVEKMREGAKCLIGEHDFKSFSTARWDVEDTVRTICQLEITKEGDMVALRVRGSGFLYHMVRIIAGTLIKVGLGFYPPSRVEEILDARDRRLAGPRALAKGLTLVGLEYEKELVPIIKGENKDWSYQLIQKETVLKKKAYLLIRRCKEEEFDRLLARVIHQAVRNGAEQVYMPEPGHPCQIQEGKQYGRYALRHVYDMVKMRKNISPGEASAEEPSHGKLSQGKITQGKIAQGKVALIPLAEGEMDLYVRIHNEAFFPVPNSATLDVGEMEKRFQEEGLGLFLIWDQDMLVGVAQLADRGSGQLEVEGIAISPACQGQGRGRRALRAIEAYGREQGFQALTLLVSTGNQVPWHLYQSYGFEPEGEGTRWYMAEAGLPEFS